MISTTSPKKVKHDSRTNEPIVEAAALVADFFVGTPFTYTLN
jgi:hypothetical protein